MQAQRTLENIPTKEFEEVVSNFIEKAARWDESLPIETFFSALDELTPSYSHNQTPLSVIATVVDGQLFLETHPESPLTAEGNTIWLEDGKELVIQLQPA